MIEDVRNNRWQPWSEDELDRLNEMTDKGYTCKQIGKALNRTPEAVRATRLDRTRWNRIIEAAGDAIVPQVAAKFFEGIRYAERFNS